MKKPFTDANPLRHLRPEILETQARYFNRERKKNRIVAGSLLTSAILIGVGEGWALKESLEKHKAGDAQPAFIFSIGTAAVVGLLAGAGSRALEAYDNKIRRNRSLETADRARQAQANLG